MSTNNIEILEQSLLKIKNKENKIYFLVYDTNEKARASVKHIYDMALTLHKNEFNVVLLAENKHFKGVSSWLGDTYDDLTVLYIADDEIRVNIEDILVVPEYYSNTLPQLEAVRATKVMLLQQMNYMFETLPLGSKWADFGFEKAITTTGLAKNYINGLFPDTVVYTIPPIIGDQFSETEKPRKPFIAITCRDRSVTTRIISEFYLKYPLLRWVSFKDMVNLSYDEFAEALKECAMAVWVDNESTFGTFPLECMKSGVPVVGRVPETQPTWMGENGMWTYETEELVGMVGSFMSSWVDGYDITEKMKENMLETVAEHSTQKDCDKIVNIFKSINNSREELLIKTINKQKEQKDENGKG